MKETLAQLESALVDVRKAYRALHDYQRACLDAVSYIGTQIGFKYEGGYPLLSNASPGLGKGRLKSWSWDWLNLIYYDFYFTRQEKAQKLFLLIRLFSDTGVFDAGPGTSREPRVSDFHPAERSRTVVAFLLYPKWRESMKDFQSNAEQIRRFLQTGTELPQAWTEAGAVGMCCTFARIASVESTNEVIEEIIKRGLSAGFPLARTART